MELGAWSDHDECWPPNGESCVNMVYRKRAPQGEPCPRWCTVDPAYHPPYPPPTLSSLAPWLWTQIGQLVSLCYHSYPVCSVSNLTGRRRFMFEKKTRKNR